MKTNFGALAASSISQQAHELTVRPILMPEAPTIYLAAELKRRSDHMSDRPATHLGASHSITAQA
jgi:hypothetical protein